MKNGSYYGIDFGTTNTSVYLYHYEQGRGSREAGYGTDGKDLTPFSSCIAIPKQVRMTLSTLSLGVKLRKKSTNMRMIIESSHRSSRFLEQIVRL